MDIDFDLETNALDSLIHGVEHFVDKGPLTDRNLKNTVLHTFHAVELFLKARLAKAHPVLIFTKPERAEEKDAHTVEFDVLLGRLEKVGVTFLPSEKTDLASLRNYRNAIEHYKLKADRQKIKDYVGRAVRFLEAFLEAELDIVLREKVDVATYETLSEAIHSYEERVKRAVADMEAALPSDPKNVRRYERMYSDRCGETTILNPDPTAEPPLVHCFFCKAEYQTVECFHCSCAILIPNGDDPDEASGLCDDCRAEPFEH